MSNLAIRVENLSKRYRIGVKEKPVQNPWEVVRSLASSPFKYLGRMLRPPTEEETIWALKDVSFEVKKGEVVGIIGRNGAGKSTLLKILSRITEPTEGRVEMYGRVGSLLEVGTGFHSELTGRENIYLSGAILGMKKAEIDRKFDEIVAFAGVEKFIDTPVKRYSSGMYVRLAFAVAAHLETEILLVDEVLAVGDAEFQKKCLGKMGDVAKEGRTVLFVSHNMGAVSKLCFKCLLFEGGFLQIYGSTMKVISAYLLKNSETEVFFEQHDEIAGININVNVRSITSKNTNFNRLIFFFFTIEFVVKVNTKKTINKAGLGIGITDIYGQRIVTLHTHYQTRKEWTVKKEAKFIATWKENFLCPGNYILTISVFEGKRTIVNWPNAGMFSIAQFDYYNTGKLPDTKYQGYVLPRCNWNVVNI